MMSPRCRRRICRLTRRALVLAFAALGAANAAAAERHVGPGQPYATIQAGVDAAQAGDVVVIHDGIYVENVIVDRSLDLRSQDYIDHGENDGAVIDASSVAGYGILVTADAVTIEGLSLFGAAGEVDDAHYAGIGVVGGHGCTIAHNRCGWEFPHRNDIGLLLRGADNATVVGNEIAFGLHGIWIEDTRTAQVTGNDIHDNVYEPDSGGITLRGSATKDASSTAANRIFGNEIHANNIGIYLDTTATGNVVTGNTIDGCYVGAFAQTACDYTVLSNNVIRNCDSRGIEINGSSGCAVTGNRLENDGVGVWLGYLEPVDAGADRCLVARNTFTGNATGLRISAESDDVGVFLNGFVANTHHVDSSGAAWQTVTAVSYFHDGANHGNWLGNYYDTYDGDDLDGDGVGDTALPFIDGDAAQGPVEAHPLVAPPDDYAVQAWGLGGGAHPVMRLAGLDDRIDAMPLLAGASITWPSATVSVAPVDFASGAWRGALRFAAVPDGGPLRVEIGIMDGGTFVASGAVAELTTVAWQTSFVTSAAPVTVAAGQRLALRLTNLGSGAASVLAGGGSSFVTSPALGDPQWPGGVVAVPDTPPTRARLLPNRPNPFNPRTTIAFELAAPARVDLVIHDLGGRRVRTMLRAADLTAGVHTVVWDGRDGGGNPAPSGAYLCRLVTPAGAVARRLMLVR